MILGITGTIGAGKGTVVDYLIKEKHFRHFSAREFLLKEIKERGIAQDRDNMKKVANELRTNHSPSYIIEQLFSEAEAYNGDVVIESVRTFGEVGFLKSHGAKILAVDADRNLRYKRISDRGLSTDGVSFEKFCIQEDAELKNDDPNKQNLLGVMRSADCLIKNNGTLDELHSNVDRVLIKKL